MLTQKTYPKEKQTKWLLTVALILSLFSFSGYVSSSQSLKQATQTELPISGNLKTSKRGVSYYQSFEKRKPETPLVSQNYQAIYRFTYNRLVQVRFRNLSKQPRVKNTLDDFFHAKISPLSSKEDDFVSDIG